MDDSLKFAGLLPPLRIPSHKPKVKLEKLRIGEFREGVVLTDGLSVDVGLDEPLGLRFKVAPNKRVTTRVTSVRPLEGVLAERYQTGEYWGYTVEVKGIEDMLSDSRFNLKIATSRYGTPLGTTIGPIHDAIGRSKGVMIDLRVP